MLTRLRRIPSCRGKNSSLLPLILSRRNNNSALINEQTIDSLRIGANTRVIFQGLTGRQATATAQESLEWGTKVVGGTKPGFTGEHLGLPVLPTVRQAVEELKPDATAIFVPGHLTAKAIEEAIDAEVPLIVAVAEHVPVHDLLRVHQMLKTQERSRLLGPNSPGIISVTGRCRIGFQPLPFYTPGKVGIIARSGTLSYEAVASTTRAGLGQSLCIGIGGDLIPGTNMVEALQILQNDEDTEAIIVIGEIGGTFEYYVAETINKWRKEEVKVKPIAALVAGLHSPEYTIMGHAGAVHMHGHHSVDKKINKLRMAGVTIVNHPEKFGEALKTRLLERDQGIEPKIGIPPKYPPLLQPKNSMWAKDRPMVSVDQRRGYHATSVRRRDVPLDELRAYLGVRGDLDRDHRLGLFDVFPNKSVSVNRNIVRMGVGIDQRFINPRFLIWQDNNEGVKLWKGARELRTIPIFNAPRNCYKYDPDNLDEQVSMTMVREMRGKCRWQITTDPVVRYLMKVLLRIFYETGAARVEIEAVNHCIGKNKPRWMCVNNLTILPDEAAVLPPKELPPMEIDPEKTPNEVVAPPATTKKEPAPQKEEICYVRLQGLNRYIGTLVNGAGLAMNTIDGLEDAGGRATNFLDTGGKATKETIKHSFEMILADSRVLAIFVNIFGGITKCDVIAEGIMLAFKELDIKVPVVVRLRGTNEAQGQQMIADSGLPILAFDSFAEAAAKVTAIVNEDPGVAERHKAMQEDLKRAEEERAVQKAQMHEKLRIDALERKEKRERKQEEEKRRKAFMAEMRAQFKALKKLEKEGKAFTPEWEALNAENKERWAEWRILHPPKNHHKLPERMRGRRWTVKLDEKRIRRKLDRPQFEWADQDNALEGSEKSEFDRLAQESLRQRRETVGPSSGKRPLKSWGSSF